MIPGAAKVAAAERGKQSLTLDTQLGRRSRQWNAYHGDGEREICCAAAQSHHPGEV